jgi:signal peptide peptidase SppA
MKDYSRIIGKITSTPWMITPDALKLMLDVFDAHLSGTITQEDLRLRLQDTERKDDSRVQRNGSVGVLSLQGPIFPKANLMTELSGATSIAQFRDEFRSLMADDSVDAILLDIDSPGGLSEQIDEMATEIREARDTKPIYAIANASANSAAFYLGSQATKMFATPSGQVGSIGTYMVHMDNSELKERIGVKETIIKAGRFKAAIIEPLTPDSREYLQDHISQVNADFIKAVALGRKVSQKEVTQNYGEGGIVTPKRAAEVGMIDGVMTYDAVLESMSEGGGVSLSMKQSYDAAKEHSEPGTGQGDEPTPREEPEEGDPAIEGGWRRDTPPVVNELQEVKLVDREWLEARASSLGVEFSEETSDEDLSEAVASRIEEIVVPLTDATADAEAQRAFAESYPEQAAQMDKLLAESRNNAAITFAESYRTFEDNSKLGFSTTVRDQLSDAHMKVAERRFTQDDLKSLMDAVVAKEATVPLGEEGSARLGEPVEAARPGLEVRKQFAELVRNAMTEDSLDRDAAINHVAQQNPELFAAYRNSR